MIHILSREDAFQDMGDLIEDILVQFNKGSQEVDVWSFSEAAMRSVKAMAPIFLENTRQKLILLHRKELANKKMDTDNQQVVDGHVEEVGF